MPIILVFRFPAIFLPSSRGNAGRRANGGSLFPSNRAMLSSLAPDYHKHYYTPCVSPRHFFTTNGGQISAFYLFLGRTVRVGATTSEYKRRMLDDEQAVVHYFHLVTKRCGRQILLITYINYTPCNASAHVAALSSRFTVESGVYSVVIVIYENIIQRRVPYPSNGMVGARDLRTDEIFPKTTALSIKYAKGLTQNGETTPSPPFHCSFITSSLGLLCGVWTSEVELDLVTSHLHEMLRKAHLLSKEVGTVIKGNEMEGREREEELRKLGQYGMDHFVKGVSLGDIQDHELAPSSVGVILCTIIGFR
ncbi:unnamed protein product [Hymenolepis diminuta]|uniref:Uncharacterized protein n=1 Tax=Hymenolepis diminuta TaxID=6216 RepID=A0A564Y0C6_HYMDI|nr:unnamed protein product [Hymenolepis diminuta]